MKNNDPLRLGVAQPKGLSNEALISPMLIRSSTDQNSRKKMIASIIQRSGIKRTEKWTSV